jgi:hypothetical protein
MDIVEIVRSSSTSNAKVTFGDIYVNGKKQGVTLELPLGQRISTGVYSASLRRSPRANRDVIWLDNVNGDTLIQIHAGNFVTDTKGCILVGANRNGNKIENSRKTLDAIIGALVKPKNIQVIVR